jgi:hypothetical protein
VHHLQLVILVRFQSNRATQQHGRLPSGTAHTTALLAGISDSGVAWAQCESYGGRTLPGPAYKTLREVERALQQPDAPDLAGATLDELYVKVAGCLQPFTQRIVLLVRAIVVCVFLIIALIVYVFLPISEGYNQMALSKGYYLALTGAVLEMACLGWNIFGDRGDAAEANAHAADACDDKAVEELKQCDTANVDTTAANTTIEAKV